MNAARARTDNGVPVASPNALFGLVRGQAGAYHDSEVGGLDRAIFE
jgi:hypothetical protein